MSKKKVLKKTAIEDITHHLEIFDVVLIGDGSGINKACGWSVVEVNNFEGKIHHFTGAYSHSTVNIVELVGYIHALVEIEKRLPSGKKASKCSPEDKPSVAILTDSLLTYKCGSGQATPKANLAFWAAVDDLRRVFSITFYYYPRTKLDFNTYCDALANESRLAMAELVKRSHLSTNYSTLENYEVVSE